MTRAKKVVEQIEQPLEKVDKTTGEVSLEDVCNQAEIELYPEMCKERLKKANGKV